MQANRNIHLCQEKAPIYKLPHIKPLKKLAVTDMREKPVYFFQDTTPAVTFAPPIIWQTEVPLQKFPFL